MEAETMVTQMYRHPGRSSVWMPSLALLQTKREVRQDSNHCWEGPVLYQAPGLRSVPGQLSFSQPATGCHMSSNLQPTFWYWLIQIVLHKGPLSGCCCWVNFCVVFFPSTTYHNECSRLYVSLILFGRSLWNLDLCLLLLPVISQLIVSKYDRYVGPLGCYANVCCHVISLASKRTLQ